MRPVESPGRALPIAPPDPAGEANQALKAAILAAARAQGFDLAGVAPAGGWATGDALPGWIAQGFAGEMDYMTEAPEERADPRGRFPWARSIVMLGLDYRVDAPGAPAATARPFSRYAWGDDYHPLIEKKLTRLKAEILRLGGAGTEARWYVDSGRILERAAAAEAGLGWHAKSTMLINEGRGSNFFLSGVLTSLALPLDRAAPGRCGSCTRCLEACPTRAFKAPYLLDARRCISYLTIELQGAIPRELRPLMGEMVFGCDICQDVCPWNERAARRVAPSTIEDFRPRPGFATGALEDLVLLITLDEAAFRARFRRSPAKRTGRAAIARNACVALGNRGDPAALPMLKDALAHDPAPLVRAHAAWAIGRISATLAVDHPARRAAQVALESAAASDEAPDVREEARLALG